MEVLTMMDIVMFAQRFEEPAAELLAAVLRHPRVV